MLRKLMGLLVCTLFVCTATAAFADVDADGDGKVTHREFVAYLKANCSI